VQEVIKTRLAAMDCEVSSLTYDPATVPMKGEIAATGKPKGKRTAVVGQHAGNPDKRSLLIFAHPDGEPLQSDHGWAHDPFEGSVENGRFYGWGVADDLAGCAAAVLALEAALETGADLGQVIVASAPSKYYARGVAAVLHDGLDADASIYLHPAESGGGMREIKTVTAGHLELRITVTGRLPDTAEPGHTAFTHLAVNPVDKAMAIAGALRDLAETRAARIRHPLFHAAVGRSTNIQISSLLCGVMNKFSRLSETCQMGVAISFPPGETLQEVQAEIEKALNAFFDADEWLRDHRPRLEWLTGVTGAEVPDSHPLYQIASAAVEHATGTAPHVYPLHTSSDIRNPAVEKGIPTIALGCLCGDLTQNNQRDEWIDVADFHRMVDVTTEIVLNWCSRPRSDLPARP
jgi:acetylornithine deacetylase